MFIFCDYRLEVRVNIVNGDGELDDLSIKRRGMVRMSAGLVQKL